MGRRKKIGRNKNTVVDEGVKKNSLITEKRKLKSLGSFLSGSPASASSLSSYAGVFQRSTGNKPFINLIIRVWNSDRY